MYQTQSRQPLSSQPRIQSDWPSPACSDMWLCVSGHIRSPSPLFAISNDNFHPSSNLYHSHLVTLILSLSSRHYLKTSIQQETLRYTECISPVCLSPPAVFLSLLLTDSRCSSPRQHASPSTKAPRRQALRDSVHGRRWRGRFDASLSYYARC